MMFGSSGFNASMNSKGKGSDCRIWNEDVASMAFRYESVVRYEHWRIFVAASMSFLALKDSPVTWSWYISTRSSRCVPHNSAHWARFWMSDPFWAIFSNDIPECKVEVASFKFKSFGRQKSFQSRFYHESRCFNRENFMVKYETTVHINVDRKWWKAVYYLKVISVTKIFFPRMPTFLTIPPCLIPTCPQRKTRLVQVVVAPSCLWHCIETHTSGFEHN